MKIKYVNRTPIKLYTFGDLAQRLGVTYNSVWCLIQRVGALRPPTYRVGRRDYYLESDFEAVVKEAAALIGDEAESPVA